MQITCIAKPRLTLADLGGHTHREHVNPPFILKSVLKPTIHYMQLLSLATGNFIVCA